MASVSLENISKTYGRRHGQVLAVDDLNLEVEDRACVVIVGPSGCGKSTTLRMVAGLERPSQGRVRISGTDVAGRAPNDRDVAMVFQDHALYPHLTVKKNLAFGLKMRGAAKAEIEKKVSEAASLLGLTPLLDRKPPALSGGECQRVALGRAIVRDPGVFLFDEPLSNLDARLRLNMRTEIKTLQQNLGATMLYVTHDQEEAMTLGDRLVVLHCGRVQQQGAPLDVYQNPANRFVAEFIGTPTINMLPGTIELADGKITFAGSGFRFTPETALRLALERHAGATVHMGVRPERCRIIATGDERAPHPHIGVACSVRLVEHLGDSALVFVASRAGVNLVARMGSGMEFVVGDNVEVGFDPTTAHFFDDGGSRLY